MPRKLQARSRRPTRMCVLLVLYLRVRMRVVRMSVCVQHRTGRGLELLVRPLRMMLRCDLRLCDSYWVASLRLLCLCVRLCLLLRLKLIVHMQLRVRLRLRLCLRRRCLLLERQVCGVRLDVSGVYLSMGLYRLAVHVGRYLQHLSGKHLLLLWLLRDKVAVHSCR